MSAPRTPLQAAQIEAAEIAARMSTAQLQDWLDFGRLCVAFKPDIRPKNRKLRLPPNVIPLFGRRPKPVESAAPDISA